MGTIEVYTNWNMLQDVLLFPPCLESNGCTYHLLIDNGSLLSFRYCQYMSLSIHLTEEPIFLIGLCFWLILCVKITKKSHTITFVNVFSSVFRQILNNPPQETSPDAPSPGLRPGTFPFHTPALTQRDLELAAVVAG